MIKIGEFARLGCVSIKTLRHYDRLRLLEPAHVDHYTGYRYYELDQLKRLNEILLLKLMGFSLERISYIMQHRSPEQWQQLLRAQEAELRSQQQEVNERLRWLRTSPQEAVHDSRVLLKSQPALCLAVLSCELPLEDHAAARKQLEAARAALEAAIPRELREPSAPFWAVLYNESGEDDSETQTVQVGLPLMSAQCSARWKNAASLPEGIQPRLLPAHESVLSLLIDPARHTLEEARLTLFQQAQQQAYRFDGSFLELHYQDEQQHLIELQRPIERALPPQPTEPPRRNETMDVSITRKPAQLYMGQSRIFSHNTTDRISAFWNEFCIQWEVIQNLLIAPKAPGFHSLGLCSPLAGSEDFQYMIAFPLKDNTLTDLPAGMELRLLPEQDYVVVPAPGASENIRKAYSYAFETWLPQQTEWEYDNSKPDFEYYPPEFNDFQEGSMVYVYVPIRKKA